MTLKRMIQASLVGLVLAGPYATQSSAQSVLQVLRGATSNNIQVAVNKAIVMESDRPFAELSVANPGIADIATLGERTIYVLGKAPGRTTLTILGEEGELITNVDVQVSPDVAEFKERLRDILPREPIDVRTANDGIVLSGRVSGARKVSRALELAERYAPGRVTNLMVVGGTQQVNLQVRFAEMTREVAKAIGAHAAFSGNIGEVDLIPGAIDGGTGIGNGASGNQYGSIGLDFDIGNVGIELLIEALENKGIVRTLAEPNLVALSGQTAEFLAGGEFPIAVVDGDGDVTIEFRPFGVALDFSPTVVDGDLINLELGASVSQLNFEVTVGEFPTVDIRSTSTNVELRDGQSFAIAGLLSDEFTDTASQVPWIGDVPVLGALFRSSSFVRRQSELVIIVTAHLVTPVDGDLLALPTDRIRIPTEAELFLNGNVEGAPVVQDIARQDFSGSYGYVME